VKEFPSDSSDFVYTIFRLKADYLYTNSKSSTVNIYQTEDHEEACSFLNSFEECDEALNCKPQFINDDFSGCVACKYGTCEGQYGSDQEDCYSDPCKLSEQIGECYWDGERENCKTDLEENI
jgi:hypothetical protein